MRPAGKTLSSLTGIVVAIAVLWLLMNFVYAPSCGRFSCSWVPSWIPQAQADTAQACPGSWKDAAGDQGWVRDRLASIKGDKITTGVVFDEDGAAHTFTSGRDDAAATALKVGQEIGAFPPVGRPNVVDHVEVKVAAAMREGGVRHGLLVINKSSGPCAPDEALPFMCVNMVPKLLSAGAELLVYWEDDQGQLRSRRFVGEG